MPSAKMIARKIGLIDAFLFFIVWSCIGLLSVAHPYNALPIIVFLLVPTSALVGWRGSVSVSLMFSEAASFRRVAGEGVVGGAVLALAIWLWSFANVALAAGTVFDGLSPWQFEFWVTVATSLFPAMGVAGILGAMHGVAFYFINRWLVKANPPVNPDAPTSGAPVT